MDLGPEIMAPLTIFGSVVLVVWIVQAHGARVRQATQETIRKAIESGQQLTPELIKALGAPRRQKGGDLRWGLIWLAIALAFAIFGAMFLFVDDGDANEAVPVMMGIAAFPGMIGLALLGVHFLLGANKDD